MKWPIRHNSASSDPVTRERRMKRLGHFIERAKNRAAPEREPLRTPAETTVNVHRVHAMPLKRRTSSTVAPKLLWLTRPLGHHQTGAERLLRRAGRHMKPKSGSQAEASLPILEPSDQSNRSRFSAPDYPVISHRASSGELSMRSNANTVISGPRLRLHKRQPSLQLLSDGHRHRMDSLYVNASSSPTASIAPSSSSGSRRSMKSACADVATTKADVQAVTVSPSRSSEDKASSSSTPLSAKHVVESGHGTYEIVWDDHSSSQAADADDASSRPRSNSDPNLSRPIMPESRRESYHSSPPGLMRVNTKLEEWCYAAREATALDRTRSHPHFRSYVEVYQDPEVPTFDFEEDVSGPPTMAPPNSALPSKLASRQTSVDTTPRSFHGSASPGSRRSSESDPGEFVNTFAAHTPYTALHDTYEPELIIPTGYYSPRPNKPVESGDRLKPQSRSFSGLSSLWADTNDLGPAPPTHSYNPYCETPNVGTSRQQRQILRLQQERYPFLPAPPDHGDLINAAHRDSIVLAKDRIRRKHAAAVQVGDQQAGSTAPGLTTGPIAIPVPIPRNQQISFVGALSPILDGSPPNWVRGIDEMAKEDDERKKMEADAESNGDGKAVAEKDVHGDADKKAASAADNDVAEGYS